MTRVRAKEINNPGTRLETIAKAWATANKPNMYTSFSKRERQYDPCRAKEINNSGIRLETIAKAWATTNKPNMYTSFFISVSDNMTRVERKELTIAKACATIAKACAELTI